MGGGAGKQNRAKEVNQPPRRVPTPPSQQNYNNNSVLSPIPSRQSLSPADEQPSRTDKYMKTTNDSQSRPSTAGRSQKDHERDRNDSADENNFGLQPDNNFVARSKSPSTPRDTVLNLPPVRNQRSSTTSSRTGSSRTHHHHHHHDNSSRNHGETGRYCSHCPHCKRKDNEEASRRATPEKPWLTQKPKRDDLTINMDDYDNDAIKDAIIKNKHHLPGSYVYDNQLRIESRNDNNSTKENYCTLPFVATTKPHVSPTRTPFPDYNILQRKERRIDKPYTLPLFAN